MFGLMAKLFTNTSRPSRASRRHFRPALEGLEDRRLMSADPAGVADPGRVTATFAAGLLSVEGTEAADVITVRTGNNGKVRVRSHEDPVPIFHAGKGKFVKSVSARKVDHVHVEGGGGHDDIRMDRGSHAVKIPTLLSGGEGNDTIHGGSRFNEIDGGEGDDSVHGGKRGDALHGGFGNDTVHGERGNDTLSGGGDDDRLFGGDDHDRLFGGDGGDDRLWGEDGDDWLEAGSADEFADGGDGPDRTFDYDFNAHRWAIGDTNNGFDMEDVNQGRAGNCTFLAALAGLARNGWNLADHIEYAGNYLYKVKLFVDAEGMWDDDWIDVEGGGIFEFGGDGQELWQDVYFDGKRYRNDAISWTEGEFREFWVQLFARAFEQQIGQESAGTRLVLTALTNLPLYSVHKGNHTWAEPEVPFEDRRFSDTDLQMIRDNVNAGRTVIAATYSDSVTSGKLRAKHAYTVVGVTPDGMMTLRNPHGTQDLENEDGMLTLTWEEFNRDMLVYTIADPVGIEQEGEWEEFEGPEEIDFG